MPPQSQPTEHLQRSIGLIGAVAIVVGGVLGMGVYVLVAEITAQAGRSIWLAFSVALAISVVGSLPLIQLASAMPRAGGGYFYTSRLLNPMLGTITSWWAILGGASSVAVVTVGLTSYILEFFGLDVPPIFASTVLLIVVYATYWFGVRMAISLQVVMTAQLVLALLIYGAYGVQKLELNFSPEFPQGVGGFFMAVVLSYTVVLGFQVIAEMGQEMTNPSKNIPLSLLIGCCVLLVLHVLVGAVFTASAPTDIEGLRALKAPLADSARTFLPTYFVTFLSIGAISAGLTSLNAGAIAIPRELYSQALDGVLPQWLGKVDARTHSPLNSVTFYFMFLAALVFLRLDIDYYGILAAVGILSMTTVISVAALFLPTRMPDRYAKAYIHMPIWLLYACCFASILSSLGFVAIVATEKPSVLAVYGCWTLLAIVYFSLRVRWLKRHNFDWAARTSDMRDDEPGQ